MKDTKTKHNWTYNYLNCCLKNIEFQVKPCSFEIIQNLSTFLPEKKEKIFNILKFYFNFSINEFWNINRIWNWYDTVLCGRLEFQVFLVIIPARIKDAASIQRLFFLPNTMVRFIECFLSLLYTIAQDSEKRTYFWQLFRCGYYSRASIFGVGTVC